MSGHFKTTVYGIAPALKSTQPGDYKFMFGRIQCIYTYVYFAFKGKM